MWVVGLALFVVKLIFLPFIITIQVLKCIPVLYSYWSCLLYFTKGGNYVACNSFRNNKHTKSYIYSLSLLIRLWNTQHFRGTTFNEDMKQQLRSTAIPGTGIPLSILFYSKTFLYIFIFIIIPILQGIITFFTSLSNLSKFHKTFTNQLLYPSDWCSIWIINSTLSVYHYNVVNVPGYNLESKWIFLKCASHSGFSVSPWKRIRGISVNKLNGYSSLYQSQEQFKSANSGGNWIIQDKMQNHDCLKKLLPADYPITSFRIVTSWNWIQIEPEEIEDEDDIKHIEPITCVWKVASQKQKHPLLFPIDMQSGEIQKGTSNYHWHQIGLRKIFSKPFSFEHEISRIESKDVVGKIIEPIKDMVSISCRAHSKLMAHVPLVAWDIALTEDGPKFLNLSISCNFQRGNFKKATYFKLVDDYFSRLALYRKIAAVIDDIKEDNI